MRYCSLSRAMEKNYYGILLFQGFNCRQKVSSRCFVPLSQLAISRFNWSWRVIALLLRCHHFPCCLKELLYIAMTKLQGSRIYLLHYHLESKPGISLQEILADAKRIYTQVKRSLIATQEFVQPKSAIGHGNSFMSCLQNRWSRKCLCRFYRQMLRGRFRGIFALCGRIPGMLFRHNQFLRDFERFSLKLRTNLLK